MRQLSQEELDSALSGQRAQGEPAHSEPDPVYDFCRPDRIPKSQLRAISFLHENLARNLASSLSAYLRSFVTGNLISVEQITYGAFLEALPDSTCLVPLALTPRNGCSVLEINPSLIFPILELLLGGKDVAAPGRARELTEMERHLLENLFRLIVQDVEITWRAVSDVRCQTASYDTGRQLLRTMITAETVVAVGMEFRIDQHVGMINLAIPSLLAKGMVQKFDGGVSGGNQLSEDGQRRNLKALKKATIAFEPQVSAHLTVKELQGLRQGTTVVLDHALGNPVLSAANGRIKFTGRIIDHLGERAFLIDSVLASDAGVGVR